MDERSLVTQQRRYLWGTLYKMYKGNNLSNVDKTGRSKPRGQADDGGSGAMQVSGPLDDSN